jgi:hypothetical protein
MIAQLPAHNAYSVLASKQDLAAPTPSWNGAAKKKQLNEGHSFPKGDEKVENMLEAERSLRVAFLSQGR